MKFSNFLFRRNKPQPKKQEGKDKKPFFGKGEDTAKSKKSDGAFFQPKLTIGERGDKYEQEADTVADAVVNQSNTPNIQNKGISTLQRYMTNAKEDELGTNTQRIEKDKEIQEKPIQKMESEEEPIQMMEGEEEESLQMQEEEEGIQAKAQPGKNVASSQLSQKISNTKGNGNAMSSGTKQEMESSFGVDFSGVNIHTNDESIQMNQELGAQAFTHGKDVYFNRGKFNPESKSGKHLLAHELTHVVQQNNNIQPKIQKKEGVNSTKADELKKAEAIIQRIKDNYGIDVDSQKGIDAIKKDYGSVPKSVTDNLKKKKWELKELVALEKALAHFAPILGESRKKSTRKDVGQEITSASKVDQAIDTNSASGVLDTSTLGEYFEASTNFSMFSAGTGSTIDFTDNDKQLEGTAVHEIAHGILKYALGDYVKELEFWTDTYTKSGKADAEAPITAYGKKSASEDFSEAVMYYFVDNKTLKDGVSGKTKGEAGNPCPKRHAFIKKTVEAWTTKK